MKQHKISNQQRVDGSVSRYTTATGSFLMTTPRRAKSFADHIRQGQSSHFTGNRVGHFTMKDIFNRAEQLQLKGRNFIINLRRLITQQAIGAPGRLFRLLIERAATLKLFRPLIQRATTLTLFRLLIQRAAAFMQGLVESANRIWFSNSSGNCTNCLRAIPFIALIALLTTACNVSKKPVKADVLLPAKFRTTITDSMQSESPVLVLADSLNNTVVSGGTGELSWKQFFADTTLQSLIDTAIAKNYDMQLAIKNIDAARLLFRQSRWGYAPDISLQIAAGSSRPSDNSLNGLSASQFLGTTHIEDYNASVGVSWEADIWGKIKNRKAAALASYLQSGEAKKAIQTNLIASVAQAYYNLLMLDAQLNIAARNIRLSDSTLRILRFQYNAGQVTALAVQQAEAQLNTTTALIPELEKNIVLQENALKVLSGELPATIKRSSSLNRNDMPDTLSAGIPAALLSRRPDIKARELELAIANAQVGIANANMYPALRITASGGLNTFRASNWFNIPASLFGAVAGSLVQPLLQKKQLKTEYEIAKVRREQSVIEFRQSVLNAVGEVSDALIEIEKISTARQMVNERVALLQRATGNARQLFSSGMANYLEVITAQGSVLQSELELASLTRQKLAAQVELYRSLGGGWN